MRKPEKAAGRLLEDIEECAMLPFCLSECYRLRLTFELGALKPKHEVHADESVVKYAASVIAV
jgi:hypothetical protein